MSIFKVVLNVNVVNVVSDEIIFHIVLNMGVLSVVSDETISHVPRQSGKSMNVFFLYVALQNTVVSVVNMDFISTMNLSC